MCVAQSPTVAARVCAVPPTPRTPLFISSTWDATSIEVTVGRTLNFGGSTAGYQVRVTLISATFPVVRVTKTQDANPTDDQHRVRFEVNQPVDGGALGCGGMG